MAGGCERFVHETATRIAAMPGFAVDVFANRWENADPGIRYRRVPMVRFPKLIKPWAFVRAAQRMIGRGGYDVVHAHLRNDFAHITTVHPAPHRFWLADVLNKRRPSLHDRTMIAMERRMIATASGRVFHPVSPMLLEIWKEEYGELPGRWEVQCPGVDTVRFAPNPAARAAMRRQLGIGESEFVLLFVGMNFEVKGLAHAIEGMAVLARRGTARPVRLVVAGKGPRAPFQQLANRLGVGGAMTFTGVESERLPSIYAASDGFMMLSSFETYCMAVVEAMATGLPVAITDRMGVRDLVRAVDGNVVLPSPPRPEAVATGIGTLMALAARPDRKVRMSQAAAAHEWDAVSARIAATYRDFMADRSPK